MAKHKEEKTNVMRTLEQKKIAYTAHAYDPDGPIDGVSVAAVLGQDPARVFKTLLVDTDAGLAVGIVPVDAQLDLKAVASVLGRKKATMAAPAVAERSTGYVVGGISPIGQKRALPTLLDAGATAQETILVSGGKRGFDLELAPTDLLTATRGTLAPIARR